MQRINGYTRGPMPQPRYWTHEQKVSVADWFATLSLAELRHRQSLNYQQIGMAYAITDQGRRIAALENLYVTFDCLRRGVDIQAFG